MKRTLLLFAACVLCVMGLMAQTKITGTVVDDKDNPMVGVYVTPEEGGDVVATDIDGQFEIAVPEGSVLTFSMGSKRVTAMAADGMVVTMDITEKKTWEWRKQRWMHLFTAEYGFNAKTTNGHEIGLRYGMCRYAGWFVSAKFLTTSFLFPKTEYTMKNGVVTGEVTGTPVLTGESNVNQFTFAGGLLWRMFVPLYGYAGAGYGYRMTQYMTTADVWVKNADDNQNLGMMEFGLIGDIHGVAITAGCEIIFARTTEIYPKVGVGFAIPYKKK